MHFLETDIEVGGTQEGMYIFPKKPINQSSINYLIFFYQIPLKFFRTLELEQLAVLDPVSSGKLTAMKQNIYYIESQLKQVNNVLDDQWDIFQGECKKRIT